MVKPQSSLSGIFSEKKIQGGKSMFQENEGGLEVGAIQNSIEKWLKLRGGKTTLRGGGVAKCPPSNPLKKPCL